MILIIAKLEIPNSTRTGRKKSGRPDTQRCPSSDGDAVGVTGEISEHRLGSAERPLGINHPLGAAQRSLTIRICI